MTKKPVVKVCWAENEADLKSVISLSRACYGTDSLTPQEVYKFLERTDHVLKLLKLGNAVIGYLLYRLKDKAIAIYDIAVQTRRQGHGRKLVQHVLKASDRVRSRPIYVRVPERNLEAQLFFKALGFKAYEIVPQAGGEPLYAMKYEK